MHCDVKTEVAHFGIIGNAISAELELKFSTGLLEFSTIGYGGQDSWTTFRVQMRFRFLGRDVDV